MLVGLQPGLGLALGLGVANPNPNPNPNHGAGTVGLQPLALRDHREDLVEGSWQGLGVSG